MKNKTEISKFISDCIKKHEDLHKVLLKEYLKMRNRENGSDLLDVSDLSQEEYDFFKMFLYSSSKICNDGVINEDIALINYVTNLRRVV